MGSLLEGKAALITGGASGIGKATAREFAGQGARVLIADINASRLSVTKAEFASSGLEIEAVAVDLTVKAESQNLCQTMLERFGRLDVIVNSHGISHLHDTTITETPEDVFDLTIATNLKSVFLLAGIAIPHMRERGGSIINIASIGAIVGWAGVSYAASKAGLTAVTRHIAYQEAGSNIRCNSILPGAVDTEMVKVLPRKAHMTPIPTIPGKLARIAQPEEIAYLATFLASDRAAYITGASYVIDGGLTHY